MRLTFRCEVVGVRREVVGVQGEAVGVQCEVVGVQREVVGVQCEVVGAQREEIITLLEVGLLAFGWKYRFVFDIAGRFLGVVNILNWRGFCYGILSCVQCVLVLNDFRCELIFYICVLGGELCVIYLKGYA